LIVAKDAAFTNVVIDKRNGFLLPLQKKKFVEKIQLLLHDEKLRKTMGRESHKLIEENFPPERLTEMLLKLYEQVLHTKPKERTLLRLNSTALRQLQRVTSFLDRLFRY
jgi:glycosyltransferase involved in cell wall biosynthesis